MQCFGLLVTLLHISSKTADDIVENNDKVILPGLEEETFCCTTKKWKFVDLSLHTGRQFGPIFYGQNGRVVKAMDCISIGLCTRGIESNLFRFFIWFYGEMDSNFQFEYINSS